MQHEECNCIYLQHQGSAVEFQDNFTQMFIHKRRKTSHVLTLPKPKQGQFSATSVSWTVCPYGYMNAS